LKEAESLWKNVASKRHTKDDGRIADESGNVVEEEGVDGNSAWKLKSWNERKILIIYVWKRLDVGSLNLNWMLCFPCFPLYSNFQKESRRNAFAEMKKWKPS
jgi:hypothetical protein